MKILKVAAIGLISIGGYAQGATVSTANFQSIADITAITNPDSTPASGGIASFGYFSALSDVQVLALAMVPENIPTLAAGFTSIGTTTLDTESAGSGIYSGNFDMVDLQGATNEGKHLYSFLGNESTLALSVEFILWVHTDVIDIETPTSPDSNSLLLGIEGEALFSGGLTTTDVDLGNGEQEVGGIKLAAAVTVPEPSVLLLSALGMLGLLRRKR